MMLKSLVDSPDTGSNIIKEQKRLYEWELADLDYGTWFTRKSCVDFMLKYTLAPGKGADDSVWRDEEEGEENDAEETDPEGEAVASYTGFVHRYLSDAASMSFTSRYSISSMKSHIKEFGKSKNWHSMIRRCDNLFAVEMFMKLRPKFGGYAWNKDEIPGRPETRASALLTQKAVAVQNLERRYGHLTRTVEKVTILIAVI